MTSMTDTMNDPGVTATATRQVPTRRISFKESLRALPTHFAVDGDLILSHLAASLSAVFPELSPPTGEEMVIGFVNSEGTPGLDFPEMRVNAEAAASPIITPASTNVTPCRMTIKNRSRGRAPRSIRTPISCVRRLTE